MNGILIIDKPAGLTSHDVVARLRRILKTKKIGHTGTLDPFATGVLVMLVGKATRLARFLDKDKKSYEATVRFGFETDTGDRTGEARPTDYKFQQFTTDKIAEVLPEFTGRIEQTPPMYSAKKVAGKKLYELARQGIEIERKAVEVEISELNVAEIQDSSIKTQDSKSKTQDFGLQTQDFGLTITCTAGTYIRTLAEDIGRKIGVPCHLAELRRTKAGKFEISQAVTLEELEKIVEDEKSNEILVSMNQAILHLPNVTLDEPEIERIKNGMSLNVEKDAFADGQAIRLTDGNENLLAIGHYKDSESIVQPKIVII